jgi:hypothetical protein
MMRAETGLDYDATHLNRKGIEVDIECLRIRLELLEELLAKKRSKW